MLLVGPVSHNYFEKSFMNESCRSHQIDVNAVLFPKRSSRYVQSCSAVTTRSIEKAGMERLLTNSFAPKFTPIKKDILQYVLNYLRRSNFAFCEGKKNLIRQ